MTLRLTINRICDRCLKPFDGQQIEYGEEPSFDRSKLSLIRWTSDDKTGEVFEKVLLSYEDLCETCNGVVEKAIHKLRMDPPVPKEDPEPSASETELSDPLLEEDTRRSRVAKAAKVAAKAAKEKRDRGIENPPPPPPESPKHEDLEDDLPF